MVDSRKNLFISLISTEGVKFKSKEGEDSFIPGIPYAIWTKKNLWFKNVFRRCVCSHDCTSRTISWISTLGTWRVTVWIWGTSMIFQRISFLTN